MPIDFVAIDFETANEKRASVCAAAVIEFRNGDVIREQEWIVRPPSHLDRFNPLNIQIHGITPERVANAPEFSDIWPEMLEVINKKVVVAHNAGFDVSVLRQLLDLYGLQYPRVGILCTCVVARKTWERQYNYTLKTLANTRGYILNHHDAHDDARTCGKLLVDACRHHGCDSLEELTISADVSPGYLTEYTYCPCRASDQYRKVQRGKYPESIDRQDLCGTPVISDTFSGKSVVFTGTLISMTRQTAAQMVVERGGAVSNTLNLTSNLLVMGVQDYSRFVDSQHSHKTKKALQMIQDGYPLEIIDETEFMQLLLKGE